MAETFPDREPPTKAAKLRAGLEHIMENNRDKLQPGDKTLGGLRLGMAVKFPGQRISYAGTEQQHPDTLLPFGVEWMSDGTLKIWQDDEEARRIEGADKTPSQHSLTRQELYLTQGRSNPTLVTYWMYSGGRTDSESNDVDANNIVLDGSGERHTVRLPHPSYSALSLKRWRTHTA